MTFRLVRAAGTSLLLAAAGGCSPFGPAGYDVGIFVPPTRVAVGAGVDDAEAARRLAEGASTYLVAPTDPGSTSLKLKNRRTVELRIKVDQQASVARLGLARVGNTAFEQVVVDDPQLAWEYRRVTEIATRVLAKPAEPAKPAPANPTTPPPASTTRPKRKVTWSDAMNTQIDLRRVVRRWLVSLAVCAGALALGGSAQADDVVLLKNGGRVMGTVMSEDPGVGVKVRLSDGTVRTVAAAEVQSVQYQSQAPAAPPGGPPAAAASSPDLGTIHVEADAPATLLVDQRSVGRTPIDVKELTPGTHRLTLKFDAGGEIERVVLVDAGTVQQVHIEQTSGDRYSTYRKGLKFGLGLEPSGGALFSFGRNEVTAGGVATGFGNIALSNVVDLRLEALVGAFGVNDFGLLIQVGGGGALRFNIGSVYSNEIGVDLGPEMLLGSFGLGGFFIAPQTSIASFRFGEKRQFELTVRERAEIHFLGGNFQPVGFQQGIGFAYLFL